MGAFDLPASLEKVSEINGRTDIIYITISLGAQIGYVYATSAPEEAKKRIKLIINIGPGMYPGDNESKFYLITQFQNEIKVLGSFFEFLLIFGCFVPESQ